jgi:hypothetical protein
VPELVPAQALVRKRFPELEVVDLAGLGGDAREHVHPARLLRQDLSGRGHCHVCANSGHGQQHRDEGEGKTDAWPSRRFPQFHEHPPRLGGHDCGHEKPEPRLTWR